MSHKSRTKNRLRHEAIATKVPHGFVHYLRSGHMLEWPVALDALIRVSGFEHAGALHVMSLGGVVIAVALLIVARNSA